MAWVASLDPDLLVVGFGAAFQLELFAYGKTGNWAEFIVIRQDVILKIAEIVETSGTGLAGPIQLNYLSSDPGFDPDKSMAICVM